MRKKIIITLISTLLLFSFFSFYFKDYFLLHYYLSKSIITDNNGKEELNTFKYLKKFLENRNTDDSEKYLNDIAYIQKTLTEYGIVIKKEDIIINLSSLTKNIICENDNKNYYCEYIQFEEEKNSINSSYLCDKYSDNTIKRDCQNIKNQILDINGFSHCSNTLCKNLNIIYINESKKSIISESCKQLENDGLYKKCTELYNEYISYKKNPLLNNEYEKILGNKNLGEIEKIVHLNIFSGYDAIPEKNCNSLIDIEKINKCSLLYKNMLDYISKREKYLLFEQIIKKTSENNY